ncbi:ejaculatory bulb-specific protein 3-like [Periplaneta americana]|uniref:ejaculatory bulb-specific protein 3-like n=1 Tax=Periplaneta americana TaxID=6978 RepID=UPI0037E7BC2A
MGDLILDCSADKCPLSIHSVFAMVQGAAVVLILAALLASPAAPGMVREEQYVAKFDNMYVGDIVTNDQVLDSYIRCFLDTGTCTVDGAQLKATLANIHQNGCPPCSREHKRGAALIVRFLHDNKPAQWMKLREKYDPENVYFNKLTI